MAERIKTNCRNCDKEVFRIPSLAMRPFCSRECSTKYNTQHKIGWHSKAASAKAAEYRRKNKIGFYNKENAAKTGLIGVQTQIKNRTGFHSIENQMKAAKMGFAAVCKNKNIEFENVLFHSKREAEIAMNLFEQFNIKFLHDETYQIHIGDKFYDFFIKEYNCFLEYHQIIPFFDKNETEQSYYDSRRKNLDEHGYKDSELIVIFE